MEVGKGTTMGGETDVVWGSTNVEKVRVNREHTTKSKGHGSPLTSTVDRSDTCAELVVRRI